MLLDLAHISNAAHAQSHLSHSGPSESSFPLFCHLVSNYSETSLSMLEGPACQLLCEQFCGGKYAFADVSGACIQDK